MVSFSMRTENIRIFHEKKINLLGSDFLEKIQIGYLNAILDKISKELRKDD